MSVVVIVAAVVVLGRLVQRSFTTREGENRTVVEMQVNEIGPSLRYAKAQVTRQPRGGGQAGPTAFGSGLSQPQQQVPAQQAPVSTPAGPLSPVQASPWPTYGQTPPGTDEPPF